jgi:hypothetical protein
MQARNKLFLEVPTANGKTRLHFSLRAHATHGVRQSVLLPAQSLRVNVPSWLGERIRASAKLREKEIEH